MAERQDFEFVFEPNGLSVRKASREVSAPTKDADWKEFVPWVFNVGRGGPKKVGILDAVAKYER